jgi:hypothetical protein
VILTTLYLAGAKNTDSWCARKGGLQHAFPLDVTMVPSSALVVAPRDGLGTVITTPLADQATTTILPWQEMPRSDDHLTIERRHACREAEQ